MRIFSKSRILTGILVVLLCLPVMALTAYGAESTSDDDSADDSGSHSTILPDTGKLGVFECEFVMKWVDSHTTVRTTNPDVQPGTEGSVVITTPIKDAIAKRSKEIKIGEGEIEFTLKYTEILGCAIKTGNIKTWMIPFFIRYVLEFIIGLAGLLAVAGVVYGGYLYLFAGLSADKDKGKNAIKNGIIGLVLVLTAWAVVNIVISLVTM